MNKCGSFKGNKMFIKTLYPLKDQYMQDLNRNDNKNEARSNYGCLVLAPFVLQGNRRTPI